MDLMYETAYGVKFHGRAVVSVKPGMFSIGVEPDESDPEMDAIHIHAAPPWEKIDNVETFYLAMDTLKAVNPRVYDSVMRKMRAL